MTNFSKKIFAVIALVLVSFGGVAIYTSFYASNADSLPKMGLIEEVQLVDLKINFLAKTDTGAMTSVINAQGIERFQKNGKDWVRFTIVNKSGTSKRLERPIFRIVDIQRAGAPDEYRPVVLFKMCLGGFMKEAQFALKNRSAMGYPMLIGRRIINKNFLVDPSKKRLTKPTCK